MPSMLIFNKRKQFLSLLLHLFEAIIEMYLKDKGDDTVDVDVLVSDLAGFSGADLANIVNLGGIEAVKEKKSKVNKLLIFFRNWSIIDLSYLG